MASYRGGDRVATRPTAESLDAHDDEGAPKSAQYSGRGDRALRGIGERSGKTFESARDRLEFEGVVCRDIGSRRKSCLEDLLCCRREARLCATEEAA